MGDRENPKKAARIIRPLEFLHQIGVSFFTNPNGQGGLVASTNVEPAPNSPLSIADSLARLHDLKCRGLLSPEEYDGKKVELLAELGV